MKKPLHTKMPHESKSEKELFERVQLPYSRSKADVWDAISKQIDDPVASKRKRTLLTRRVRINMVAAVGLLLFSMAIFARFYTKSIQCPNGRHLSHQLPDGSVIELNAGSALSYHPYWWSYARLVHFEGEAFFKVIKGKKFEVQSGLGATTVLGTSFNIYSRGDAYKVSCITGKVRVVSETGKEVTLEMFEKAEVDALGNIEVRTHINRLHETAWAHQMFNFTATPFDEVIAEIERQYNVSISSDTALDYIYTGYFEKETSVEGTLKVVCKPFGLTFVRHSNSRYEILKN